MKGKKKKKSAKAQRRGPTIQLGPYSIVPDKSGQYIVRQDQLQDIDLATLPQGVTFTFDNRGMHLDKEHPVVPISVCNQGEGLIELNAYYGQCPHCWDHVFDYRAFMLHAARLLQEHAKTAGASFTFKEAAMFEEGEMILQFGTVTQHHRLHEAWQRVDKLVRDVLQPLEETRKAVDELAAKHSAV